MKPKEKTSFRLDPGVHAEIQKVCKKQGVKSGWLASKIFIRFIKKYEESDEKTRQKIISDLFLLKL